MLHPFDKNCKKYHQKLILDPLSSQKPQSLIKIKTKEQNFILDCINEKQSQLPFYNYLKDKYLSYFILKIPKKSKIDGLKLQKKSEANSKTLKCFIERKKNKILNQKRRFQDENCIYQQIRQRPLKKKKSARKKKFKINDGRPVKTDDQFNLTKLKQINQNNSVNGISKKPLAQKNQSLLNDYSELN